MIIHQVQLTNQQIHSYTITQIQSNIHWYTDKSHAVINIIQCHFHAPHEITYSYTGNVQ